MVENLIQAFPLNNSDLDVLGKLADSLSCDADQIRPCASEEASAVPVVQDEAPQTAVGAPDTEAWPPDDGWHFQPGRAAFHGVVFSISGKPHKLLQELARARRPLNRDELGDAISRDSNLEAGTIRGYLSDIRKILRSAFGLSEEQDPIPRIDSDPAAYRLNSDLLKPRC
jgi:hypothetical protein